MWVKTRREKETKETAGLLAKRLLKRGSKRALIIGLQGELGSGKTTFVRGFARGLGIKHRLTSPTFLILRKYQISKPKFHTTFYHVDAYRIRKPKELEMLGFREILNNPKNIVLVEWADKILKMLPKRTLIIELRHGRKENERLIKIKSRSL